MQMVAQAWTKRGPETDLSLGMVGHAGAKDVEDLLEGYTTNRYQVEGCAAPLIFRIAESGDQVACELVNWAASEVRRISQGGHPPAQFSDAGI